MICADQEPILFRQEVFLVQSFRRARSCTTTLQNFSKQELPKSTTLVLKVEQVTQRFGSAELTAIKRVLSQTQIIKEFPAEFQLPISPQEN